MRHRARYATAGSLAAAFLFGLCIQMWPHDLSTTPITWNREISRIFYSHCASCHREGGTSFPMMTYPQAQPRAVAIRDAVTSRRMPPWGAVKGFGDFRNDQGLTQEQIELIVDWVESDMPKGNNPNALPKVPAFEKTPSFKPPSGGILVSGELALQQPLTLDGLWPESVPVGSSMQITAALPDGRIEPLLWLYEYKTSYRHPFLLRKPIELPSGTVIRGVPRQASILLLPVVGAKARRSE
jgi:hypothetical protein